MIHRFPELAPGVEEDMDLLWLYSPCAPPSNWGAMAAALCFEPIHRPPDLRCGPIYVHSASSRGAIPQRVHRIATRELALLRHRQHVQEHLDAADDRWRGSEHARPGLPARVVLPSSILWAVLNVPPLIRLLGIGPLCNLAPLVQVAAEEHAKSRTTRPRDVWLERLAQKALVGAAEADVLERVRGGASALLRAAGEAYHSSARGRRTG